MPSPSPPQPQPQSWPRFLRTALASLAMALALAVGLIAVMNPYGNLPVRAFGGHVIMDTNDRFQYPAIVRSRRFDLVVLGSSTARLLDPARLEAAFGGRFANLALNDGRAWEQTQLASLFLATEPQTQTISRRPRLGVVCGRCRHRPHLADPYLSALDLRRRPLERLGPSPQRPRPGDGAAPARLPCRPAAGPLSRQRLRCVRAARDGLRCRQGAAQYLARAPARACPGNPGLPAEPGRSKGRPREDRDVGRYGASGNT